MYVVGRVGGLLGGKEVFRGKEKNNLVVRMVRMVRMAKVRHSWYSRSVALLRMQARLRIKAKSGSRARIKTFR